MFVVCTRVRLELNTSKKYLTFEKIKVLYLQSSLVYLEILDTLVGISTKPCTSSNIGIGSSSSSSSSVCLAAGPEFLVDSKVQSGIEIKVESQSTTSSEIASKVAISSNVATTSNVSIASKVSTSSSIAISSKVTTNSSITVATKVTTNSDVATSSNIATTSNIATSSNVCTSSEVSTSSKVASYVWSIATEVQSKVEVVSLLNISLSTTDSLGNLLADPDWDFLVDELAGWLDPLTDLLGLLSADLLLHLLTDGGGHSGTDLLRHSLTLLARERGEVRGRIFDNLSSTWER